MYVQYITTASDNLQNVPVVDGQIIALSDKSGYYYDMGGTRHSVYSVELVSTLPQSGELNKLYVRNNPLGLFIWVGSRYYGIETAPNDGYSYVSKNGSWCREPFIYDCKNTPADILNIQNIVNEFNDSVDHTCYLDVRYPYGGSSSISEVLTFTVRSGKTLHVDFSNMQLNNISHQFMNIFIEKYACIYITGLHANLSCSDIITLNGEGSVHISGCKFINRNDTQLVHSAIQSYGGIMLTVVDCEFNLDNISNAIILHGQSPIATITRCKFLSESNSTEHKSCYISDSNTRNVQIYGNYLPVRSVMADDKEICIQFSNSYPTYYERFRWMSMSDDPYYSCAELIGIWEEI